MHTHGLLAHVNRPNVKSAPNADPITPTRPPIHIKKQDFQTGARFTDLDQDRMAKRQYDDLVYGREGWVSEPWYVCVQDIIYMDPIS